MVVELSPDILGAAVDAGRRSLDGLAPVSDDICERWHLVPHLGRDESEPQQIRRCTVTPRRVLAPAFGF